MKLIAKYPILYKSTQYRVGQTLPTNDTAMTEAWIEAGTAAWVEEEKTSAPKARPMTAEPGLAGESRNSETDENLVGKVPETPTRTRRKKTGGSSK